MSKNIDHIEHIEKFNPYHDERGRFTSAGAATSFTYAPGKSKAHDMAIAREKERAAMANPGKEYGITQEQHEKLEQLMHTSIFSAAKYRKEIGMGDEDYQKYREKFYSKDKARENRRKAEQEKKAEEQRQRDELDERVKQELPGLNQDTIRAANNQSFFEHGSVAAREALRRVDDYKERNKIDDSMTDEQKAYMKQREAEYKQLITEYYNDSNSRFVNNPHSMITGPANFNTRAYDKKMNAAQNKAQEYEEKLKRFEENTQKKLKSMEPEEKQIAYWRNGKYKHGEKIDATDPLAEKKYQAKIDYLTEANEKAKAANRYWNKNHDMTGFDGFSESTNQKLNSQFSRIYANPSGIRNPFSTDSAAIRDAKSQLDRIKSNKAKANSGSGGNTSFNGGEIIRNVGENRLQLKFDGVPDASVRQQLKSSGWRWSPKNGVWQRQLTENAERSAQRITEGLNKSYDIIEHV